MTVENDMPATASEEPTSLTITCSVTEHVSLAYHENAIPVAREIVIENIAGQDCLDLLVRIESRPAVAQPRPCASTASRQARSITSSYRIFGSMPPCSSASRRRPASN